MKRICQIQIYIIDLAKTSLLLAMLNVLTWDTQPLCYCYTVPFAKAELFLREQPPP